MSWILALALSVVSDASRSNVSAIPGSDVDGKEDDDNNNNEDIVKTVLQLLAGTGSPC